MDKNSDTLLRDSLKQIQLRAQVALGRSLTHSDMAEIAGVGARSFGDWMRGVTAPTCMAAVFQLLSQLPEDEAIAVLDYWRTHSANSEAAGRQAPGRRKGKSSRKPDRQRSAQESTKRKTE